MKVYVVVFDAYDDCLGAEIYLFGVYDTREKAIERLRELKNQEKHMYIPDEDDNYGIEEIVLNVDCKKYLGGYTE